MLRFHGEKSHWGICRLQLKRGQIINPPTRLIARFKSSVSPVMNKRKVIPGIIRPRLNTKLKEAPSAPRSLSAFSVQENHGCKKLIWI